MKTILLLPFSLLLLVGACRPDGENILDRHSFQHYFERFNKQDTADLHVDVIPDTRMVANEDTWDFLKDQIPFFECPDKEIEEVYYYRWWTFRKHIKATPDGYVITEFMPRVSWAGAYNTIPCPAAHHFREGRWLHDPGYLTDYGQFWLRGGGDPHRYSFWIADSYLRLHRVHPMDSLLVDVMPDLVSNYEKWEELRMEPDGLFWQYDGADGMEVAVGGTGVRPTINTYMWADATAIRQMAQIAGNDSLTNTFSHKADQIKSRMLQTLWDEEDQFFKVLPRGSDSLSSCRELLGYVPWYLELVPPDQGYEVAWKQLMDPEGFFAPFGPTTAEQRHPGFRINYTGHECQWNGPSWPFATSQTLTALANVLNNYPQESVTKEDYFQLFKIYTHSHRFRQIPPDGDTIQTDHLWIDENLNPFNGDWLARTRMEVQGYNHGFQERGIYYNHSTYCDLIITGLVGLRPSPGNITVINPLIPDHWEYFCLNRVKYKGHDLTIVWDRSGQHYGIGKGLRVYINGRLVSKKKNLGRIQLKLHESQVSHGPH